MRDAPDSRLIDASLGGDEGAFAELIGRYQRAVWGTVLRILGNPAEAEDAVQETFFRAFDSLGKFDARYPFGPWVLRIAANYCVDQLRRRKARRYKLWSDLTESEKGHAVTRMSVKPDLESLSEEDRAMYLNLGQSLLGQLKATHRVAFVLREIEGQSYNAVADTLRVPEATARVWVCRARGALHKAFRRHQAARAKGSQDEKALRVV